MKKILSTIFIITIIIGTLAAQEEKDQIRERIQAKRIAFITDKLALTSKEAQAFWPLYNAFKKKEKSIRKETGKMGRIQELTDVEVEALIEKHLDKEERLLAAKRSFFKEAKQVLPIKKLAKLPRVERKFKELILKQARNY